MRIKEIGTRKDSFMHQEAKQEAPKEASKEAPKEDTKETKKANIYEEKIDNLVIDEILEKEIK